MSDQDSMTRDQLEAAGYKCRVLNYVDPEENLRYWQWRFTLDLDDDIKEQQWCDGYIFEEAAWTACLQAATSHYRQQQELARLREFKRLVEVAAQKEPPTDDPDIINAIFSIQVMKAYGKVFEESIFGLPTVSKTEQPE